MSLGISIKYVKFSIIALSIKMKYLKFRIMALSLANHPQSIKAGNPN
jgi:hypothetical protein